MHMFWRKDTEPAIPGAVSVQPSLGKDLLATYLETARAIGMEPDQGALLNERIEQALSEENIQVYNNQDVTTFLDHKLGPTWVWAGLRPIDVEHLKGWHYDVPKVRVVNFGSKPYSEAVPLAVLLTVQKILTHVPEAHFYVSAVAEPDDEDPFLAVVNQSSKMFVVERWDEPGFRSR
jgi:hypothetical protein